MIADVKPLGMKAEEFVVILKQNGIKANAFGEYRVRFVTHYGIEQDDINHTIDVISRLIKG